MPKRKPASSTLPSADTSAIEGTATKRKSPGRPRKSAASTLNKTSQKTLGEAPSESNEASPLVQLTQVAGVIPAENLQQLATAVQSGRWLFAVWHVADGRLHLERTATNFPTVDLDKSVVMLTENLKELSDPS